MKRTDPEKIKAIQRELAERKRLEKRIARLANPAIAKHHNVGVRTVQRIESGELKP